MYLISAFARIVFFHAIFMEVVVLKMTRNHGKNDACV